MFRARRTMHEPRLEMLPLIDVIFLLLTFFIFAMVLMVRADLLDVQMPRFEAGRAAERTPAITIALNARGEVFVDGEPIAMQNVPTRVLELRERTPGATVFLAADQSGRSGDLLTLVDRLVEAGIGDFSLMGSPGADQP
ncbi:MAG: biopolymer transporter ExbD [Phycisphaeraceae bacterium]|nr:MAG: biopolymer transporter ExbD [Phycisphaeraceae bacterium]